MNALLGSDGLSISHKRGVSGEGCPAVVINNANEVMKILLIITLPLPYYPKGTVPPTSRGPPTRARYRRTAAGQEHQAPESEDGGTGPWEAEVECGRQGSLPHLSGKEGGDPSFQAAWRSASGPNGGGSWAAVRRVPKL